jgi:23S rRNA (pseudouridine1915-N3)-methyltransferase
MHIQIHAINKLKSGPEYDLCQTYLKRMNWSVKLNEIQLKSAHASKQQESGEILKSMSPNQSLILLDEKGKDLTTEQFLSLIMSIHVNDHKIPTFAIGGAEGHAKELKEKAAYTISFGRQTWPHKLVRVMLIEQLYRCQSLAHGHPYHKV